MKLDFSKLFHASSKSHTRTPPEKDWPQEWKTLYYKSYPRFPKISLPRAELHADFSGLIQTRASRRNFSKQPLEKEVLSALLQYSCGITTLRDGHHPHRAHPSGGGRYPLEIYPLVIAPGGDVPPGLYHYNIKDHALDVLWERPFTPTDIAKLFTYQWAQGASCVFLMTAVFGRTQMKYAERGYRYVFLEAGHIGQNVCLASGALGLACCPLVGTRDQAIESLIDIDGTTESVLYALALGYPQNS